MFEKFLINLVIPKKNLFALISIVIIFLGFFGFMLLSYAIIGQGISTWDLEIARSLQRLPALTTFMLFVSGFYNIGLGVLIFVIALGFVYFKGYRREAAFLPAVLFTPVLNLLAVIFSPCNLKEIVFFIRLDLMSPDIIVFYLQCLIVFSLHVHHH